MNGELRFGEFDFGFESKHRKIFRIALAASIGVHILIFLTSPYWQSKTGGEPVMMVSFASVPSDQLPAIPAQAGQRPISVPETPRLLETPPPPDDTMAPLDAPYVPKTAEELRAEARARVANQGLLKVMSANPPGGAAASGPFLSGVRIGGGQGGGPGGRMPQGDDALAIKSGDLGIGKQVAQAGQAPKALAAKVFKADSGLDGEISGGIDDQNRTSQAIVATIRQYQSGIRYAYNKELLAKPDISGKITVAFVINPDGSVASPEIRQSTVNWAPLEESVVRRLQHWKFPASRGGTVRVVFPFVFHPEM